MADCGHTCCDERDDPMHDHFLSPSDCPSCKTRRDGNETCPCHSAPLPRPCKYDGEPITYDPRENVWTRRGLHEYGRHDGPCGRKLVLLRLTPGTPPSPPGGRT